MVRPSDFGSRGLCAVYNGCRVDGGAYLRIAASALFSLLITCSVCAGEAVFTAKPTVAVAGEKTTISFSVAAPIDVEISIVDAKGETVRHLAAGVLGGKNPPPPPLKAGLTQSLEWDGKDDFAKTAGNRPFKVRVRAGTGVKFGRCLGEN